MAMINAHFSLSWSRTVPSAWSWPPGGRFPNRVHRGYSLLNRPREFWTA